MVPWRSLAVLTVSVGGVIAWLVSMLMPAEQPHIDTWTPHSVETQEGPQPACPRGGTGSPVPKLVGLEGRCIGSSQRTSLGDAFAGPTTLVNLWASWCAPCREEMLVLDAYVKTPGAVRVIGVDVNDRPSAGAALVRELAMSYPSFTDADGIQGALQTPPLLPLSYLITPDGVVHRLSDVLVFSDVAQVQRSVANALGNASVR